MHDAANIMTIVTVTDYLDHRAHTRAHAHSRAYARAHARAHACAHLRTHARARAYVRSRACLFSFILPFYSGHSGFPVTTLGLLGAFWVRSGPSGAVLVVLGLLWPFWVSWGHRGLHGAPEANLGNSGPSVASLGLLLERSQSRLFGAIPGLLWGHHGLQGTPRASEEAVRLFRKPCAPLREPRMVEN